MNHTDSDPLWELLGRARRPLPSPWLTGHILRAARRAQATPAPWATLLRACRLAAVPLALCAAVAFFASRDFTTPQTDPAPQTATASPAAAPAPVEEATVFAAFDAFLANQVDTDVQWLASSR